MFLLFGLGRPDVFAGGDMALRNAIAGIYQTGSDLTRQDIEEIAFAWSPWRSIASWYLWRFLDVQSSVALP